MTAKSKEVAVHRLLLPSGVLALGVGVAAMFVGLACGGVGPSGGEAAFAVIVYEADDPDDAKR